jgi:transcriptional regulator with XRE-family HTH domain
MKRIILNKMNLSDLAELSIGKKVRYLRELLQNEYGNEFSGKSVANRINLFSQSTLTTIERGKTKDIPSKVLYAIAKEFGADLYLFFDDYYTESFDTTVELIPPLYNADQYNEAREDVANDIGIQQQPEANPLHENEYTIKTTVSKIASNQDEQLTFVYKSRVKYAESHLFYLLSQIINQINTLDVSIEPQLIESNKQFDSIKLAKDYVHYGITSLNAFPWYSNKDKLIMDNKSHEKAVKYTTQLQGNVNKSEEKRGEKENE